MEVYSNYTLLSCGRTASSCNHKTKHSVGVFELRNVQKSHLIKGEYLKVATNTPTERVCEPNKLRNLFARDSRGKWNATDFPLLTFLFCKV